MSKPTEKEVKLEIALQQVGFPKTLYFNRIRVDKDKGFCLLQFGLVVASDLVDSYSCVLTDVALQQNQNTLLEYVKKLGTDVVENNDWKGVTMSRRADVADIVSMSFRGDEAETNFSVFSMCAVTMAARKTSGEVSQLQSQPLILLRSNKALQRELINSIYG
jgi:hypothetical protein